MKECIQKKMSLAQDFRASELAILPPAKNDNSIILTTWHVNTYVSMYESAGIR